MSPDPASSVPCSALSISVEQRSYHRYEIALDVCCKPADSSEVFYGKTCDLSSHGVRFQVAKVFLPGKMLQLHIRWPLLLGEVCPLQLVILGQVIRRDRSGTVITVTRHEFCTLGKAAIGSAQPESVPVSIVA